MNAPRATALVRGIPDSFAGALRRHPGPDLDVEHARHQHAAYVDALTDAGYAIVEIPTDEQHPDCVFIEDTAVVIGSTVVVGRSGASSRRGESGPVIEELSSRFTIEAIEAPGTLDGGDVIVTGESVFVGLTERTNELGIDQLAKVCAPLGLRVRSVEVYDALHLKSVVIPVDDETVLVTPESVEEGALAGLRLLFEPAVEAYRSSALPLRDGRLLVTASSPATAGMLAAAGYELLLIDVSELLAADGGLTCLSILFDEPTS